MLTKEEKIKLINMELSIRREAINYADHVKNVIKQFNNKVMNVRLEKALQEIDPNIRLETPYNSFLIKYRTLDQEDRAIIASDGAWHYVLNDSCQIVHMCKQSPDRYRALTDDKRIIAENICEEIDRTIIHNKEIYNETMDQIQFLRYMELRHNKLILEIERYNNSIGYIIEQYFDLKINV